MYLMSRYGSDTQNNLGFNAGVVYRFGRQKKFRRRDSQTSVPK